MSNALGPAVVATTPPTVSVIVITYNHVRYIAQALKSVLSQHVNFHYNVVVLDDCSTDGTQQVLRDFAQRYPDILQLNLAARNECSNRAIAEAFRESTAKYVCLIDGDDYWTSASKLQRQVDFLEGHPECSIVFHNALVTYEGGTRAPWRITPPDFPELSTIDALWGGGFIASCSVMVRRDIADQLPDWFVASEVGDWALNIIAAERGMLGYIDDVMGVYRRHDEGVWSQLSEVEQLAKRLKFYSQLNANLNRRYQRQIERVMEQTVFEMRDSIRHCFQRGEWKVALRGLILLLRHAPSELLRDVRTGVQPAHRPRIYRRYPLLARAVTRMTSFLRTRVAADYEGNLEQADHVAIAGWAWNVTLPRTPITVVVLDGERIIARVDADRFRQDLFDAGKGNGYHAFRLRTPESLKDGAPHTIRIASADADSEPLGLPIQVRASGSG